MKRAKIGSLLFLGTTLLLLVTPSEGAAPADGARVAQDDEGPNRVARSGAASRVAGVEAGTDTTTATGPSNLVLTAVPVSANVKGAAPAPAPNLGGSGECAEGMVEVEGDYCPTLEQKCVRWMDAENVVPRRCAEFAPTGACQTKTIKKHFCIDRFEYPNKVGENPVVMKTWYEAKDACTAQGKRLCGDSEWTLACEGQDRLPYPYGYARNADACNIDKPHPDVNEKALANPSTRDAEVARLWQGEASGSREMCVSPYGAFDMTGNVDEWVVNEGGLPYKSGLKGGYWGPVRDRCRPMTTAHFEQFSFYQIGFRCCADAPSSESGKPAIPSGGGVRTPAGKIPSTNPSPGSLAGS